MKIAIRYVFFATFPTAQSPHGNTLVRVCVNLVFAVKIIPFFTALQFLCKNTKNATPPQKKFLFGKFFQIANLQFTHCKP